MTRIPDESGPGSDWQMETDLTQYQFPPSIWDAGDWSIDGYTALWCVVLVTMAVALSRKLHSRRACCLWAGSSTFICLHWLNVKGFLDDSMRPVALTNFCLIAAAALFSVASTLICLVRSVRRGKTMRGIVGGFSCLCVVLLFVYVPDSVMVTMAYSHRAASNANQCKANLNQLGLAMFNHHDTGSSFPAAKSGNPPVSWRVSLLPYLDRSDLYEEYTTSASWDADVNSSLAKTVVPVFDCPHRPVGRNLNASGQFLTAYVVPTGTGTVFDSSDRATRHSISDDTSSTLLILENCGTSIVWTAPTDVDVSNRSITVNGPSATVDHSDGIAASYHSGGAFALLADGSTRFVRDDTDPQILASLLSKAGGEDVGDW